MPPGVGLPPGTVPPGTITPVMSHIPPGVPPGAYPPNVIGWRT